VLHAARWKCRTQKIAKKSPSAHHRTTLPGYIFATIRCWIDDKYRFYTSSWERKFSRYNACRKSNHTAINISFYFATTAMPLAQFGVIASWIDGVLARQTKFIPDIRKLTEGSTLDTLLHNRLCAIASVSLDGPRYNSFYAHDAVCADTKRVLGLSTAGM